MLKPTICPAGYAYGYAPINGSHAFADLYEDTKDVTEPNSVFGLFMIDAELGYKAENTMAHRNYAGGKND